MYQKGFLGIIPIILLTAVVVTVVIALGITGQLNFQLHVEKFSFREAADTRLFALMQKTVDKFSIEELLGVYLAQGSEIINKPVSVNMDEEMRNQLELQEKVKATNYEFYVLYRDGKHLYIGPKNPPIEAVPRASSLYFIPLPYNPISLVAEVRLVDWR